MAYVDDPSDVPTPKPKLETLNDVIQLRPHTPHFRDHQNNVWQPVGFSEKDAPDLPIIRETTEAGHPSYLDQNGNTWRYMGKHRTPLLGLTDEEKKLHYEREDQKNTKQWEDRMRCMTEDSSDDEDEKKPAAKTNFANMVTHFPSDGFVAYATIYPHEFRDMPTLMKRFSRSEDSESSSEDELPALVDRIPHPDLDSDDSDTDSSIDSDAPLNYALNTEEMNHTEIIPITDPSPNSTINEWLIDSGCSNHMTPFPADFIEPLSSFDTAVVTANGGMVPVRSRGTVSTSMIDLYDPKNNRDVTITDVLLVPGLRRRLFSVSHWNESGGAVSFLQDRTNIQLRNDENDLILSVDVGPPFVIEPPEMEVHDVNNSETQHSPPRVTQEEQVTEL